MPDYDDFDDPRVASEDEAGSLDVFREDGETTPPHGGPERDPNAAPGADRPRRDPGGRPVDETVDITEHVPEGLDVGKTELSGQDLSGRMTGAGLIGITPEGAADAKRTEDPRGVERPSVGDGPPTRRKDPNERDEHGRYTGRSTVDPDDVDQSDGSPFDLSGGPNAKFEAQSSGPVDALARFLKVPDFAAAHDRAKELGEAARDRTVNLKAHDAAQAEEQAREARELAGSGTKSGSETPPASSDGTGKAEDPPEAPTGPSGVTEDEPKTTPFEDPTTSKGTPMLATELISERARAELEDDPHGTGRGQPGPKKVKDKPDVDAGQAPDAKFEAQIQPVHPRQQEDYGTGELTVSATDLVTDPPRATNASQLGGEAPVPNSTAPQESGEPLLDPNAWLGGGTAPTAPTPPPPPEPVAAEPVAAEPVAPGVPAPQVGPSPTEGQPGDFAGPPDADAPDLNAAAPDADDGFKDDAI